MKSPKPLSDRYVASLKADRQRDWIDPLRPDFGLRVNPGGSKTWWVRVPINGRRLRLKIGRWPDYTRDEAWDVARDWIKQAWRGVNPVLDRAPTTPDAALYGAQRKPAARGLAVRLWCVEGAQDGF